MEFWLFLCNTSADFSLQFTSEKRIFGIRKPTLFFFFINSCYFFPCSVYIRLMKERATLKGKKSIFQAILNLIFSVPQISRASHRHYWPGLIWVHTILVIYTVWRGYRWSVYMYVCAVTILICCTIADETSLENWPCLSLL